MLNAGNVLRNARHPDAHAIDLLEIEAFDELFVAFEPVGQPADGLLVDTDLQSAVLPSRPFHIHSSGLTFGDRPLETLPGLVSNGAPLYGVHTALDAGPERGGGTHSERNQDFPTRLANLWDDSYRNPDNHLRADLPGVSNGSQYLAKRADSPSESALSRAPHMTYGGRDQ
ncbi:hypothetical protein GCM10022255_089050 [Dactylosporangium darangshiense]|uniref:ThuA-like domain-containing protein n=1 Tax=Dactylosporangium darangshiense TaxID=579108 RepID=A0ABP8DNR6_9ACTN